MSNNKISLAVKYRPKEWDEVCRSRLYQNYFTKSD